MKLLGKMLKTRDIPDVELQCRRVDAFFLNFMHNVQRFLLAAVVGQHNSRAVCRQL